MEKVLITGGCSFSETRSPWISTWPRHLSSHLPDYRHISMAMGSQGNGLISRGVIYKVTELLKTHKPEDILVGVMWSGPDRHDFYSSDSTSLNNADGWMENPTKFIKSSFGAWVILNWHWDLPFAKQYYGTFHNRIGSLINTLEHILRTQWFLEKHKIAYFMGTYTNEVLPPICKTHVDTEHLYNQIDFSKFLPCEGEYEWCRDYSGLVFPNPNDKHPSSEQHQKFTESVILPFICDIINT